MVQGGLVRGTATAKFPWIEWLTCFSAGIVHKKTLY